MMYAALGVYSILFCVAVYFTRATIRHVCGALAGGVAVAIVGFGVEICCQSWGFWSYPSSDTGYGPPEMYPVLVMMFGLISLLGWWVFRRFGWRGEVTFLLLIAVLGTIRDYKIAGQFADLISFAPGIAPVVVDLVAWSGLAALAQVVLYLMVGPVQRNPGDRDNPRSATSGNIDSSAGH